ncbi:mitochondrial carrier [Lipomyces oligophaga]|uniref:mitochondrial carrier n=1 Tax=Lipomyces oligophaga TaxID=45792 RepID=UPI0034CD3BB4
MAVPVGTAVIVTAGAVGVSSATRAATAVAAVDAANTEPGNVRPPALVPSSTGKQTTDYIIKSGIAGGCAGCAAKTLIAPLDRVKILFQTRSPEFQKFSGNRFALARAMKYIFVNDGLPGLFQGHFATLLRIFPYAGIKFVAYEQIRTVLIANPQQETNIRRTLSGSLAGVCSVFFTYPLELVRVRLAFESRKTGSTSFRTISRAIFEETDIHSSSSSTASTSASSTVPVHSRSPLTKFRGVKNFFRGFVPTVIGMLPYAGVSFLTHDTIHDILRSGVLAQYAVTTGESTKDRHVPLKAWAQLTAGGIAGMVAQTASYPLEVIRRRLQVSGASQSTGMKLGMTSMAKLIWRENGARGFFVGLTIGYIKVVPMASCAFFVYERMKHILEI